MLSSWRFPGFNESHHGAPGRSRQIAAADAARKPPIRQGWTLQA
jgi:hypothetical protein